MAKQKNKKADKPMFTGSIMFDGNITVKLLNGEYKTLRTDFGGMLLQKADPNKELLVLTSRMIGYNEIHTGYIVRMRRYDDCELPCFGLKRDPDADAWGVLNYRDVVAWGYADGGLNDPTLFYSCQSTVAEEEEREKWRAANGVKTHAERLAELEAEQDDEADDIRRRGVVFRVQPDGEIRYNAIVGDDEVMTDHATDLMRDCAKAFCDLRDRHKEVTEVHFYTDKVVRVKE